MARKEDQLYWWKAGVDMGSSAASIFGRLRP